MRVPEGANATPTKGPDPEDFVIGDDASDISRAGTPMPTPKPVKEGVDGPILEESAPAEEDRKEAVEEKLEAKPQEKQDASTPAEKGNLDRRCASV